MPDHSLHTPWSRLLKVHPSVIVSVLLVLSCSSAALAGQLAEAAPYSSLAAALLLVIVVISAMNIRLRRLIQTRNREQTVILDSSCIGISKVENRVQVWANRSLGEIFGYPPEELKNAPTAMFYPSKETYEQLGREAYEQLGKGLTYRTELQMRRKDGALIWIRLQGNAVDPQRPTAGSVWTFEDISPRKELEAAQQAQEAKLLRSEVRFSTIFATSPDIIAITDKSSGRFIEVNDAFERIMGYSKAEAIGRTSAELGTWGNDDLRRQMLLDLGDSKRLMNYQSGFKRKNGEIFPALISLEETDIDGRPCFIISARDISEQFQLKRELSQERHFLNNIIEKATEGICVCNESSTYPHVHFTVWNPYMTEITGYSLEEINRLGWYQTVYPDETVRTAAISRMQAMREGDDIQREEWEIQRKDGEKRIVSISTTVLPENGDRTHVLAIMRDVTELRVKEEELRLSAENFQAFFDGIDYFFFVLDMEGNIIACNRTVTTRLGYAPEELLGTSVLLVHPESRREEALRIVQAMINGDTCFCPVPLVCRDGSLIPVETRVGKGCWNGKEALFGITKDISLLQRSEEKFSKAFQLNPTLMSISSLSSGIYLEVNETFLTTLGYSREEVIGKSSRALDIFDDYSQRAAMAEQLQAKGTVHGSLARIKTSNGAIRQGLFYAELFDLQEERLMVSLMLDVTEQKKAEKALHESLMFLREVEKIARIGGWKTNIETNKLVWTEGVHDIIEAPLGYKPGLAEGLKYYAPEYLPSIRESLQIALDQGTPFCREVEIITDTGKRIWTELRGVLKVDDGDTSAVVGTLQDISQRKRIEAALTAARDAADNANSAKSSFLTNMSHEIRTPLNGIMGMAQLLGMTGLNNEQKDYVDTLLTSSKNLLSLINDILDLAKIESGKLELEHIDFNLRNCLKAAINSQISQLQAKNLHHTVTIGADVPALLHGDQLRLQQLLLNLLGNAVKFTDTGGVTLTVECVERLERAVLLKFSIADTGIGISPESCDKIFAPFSQADNSTTRKYGGTGLGLSICSRLLELMGGRIWVDSSVGGGSTFHFEVPFDLSRSDIKNQGSSAPETPGTGAAAPLQILLVEDNEINQKFALHLLQKMGYRARLAPDGSAALKLWTQEPFDIILMDIQMPVMDGIEAMRIIRSQEATRGRRTPIIALTAHALLHDREKFMRQGFDGYLAKPLERGLLRAEINRVTAAAQDAGAVDDFPGS